MTAAETQIRGWNPHPGALGSKVLASTFLGQDEAEQWASCTLCAPGPSFFLSAHLSLWKALSLPHPLRHRSAITHSPRVKLSSTVIPPRGTGFQSLISHFGMKRFCRSWIFKHQSPWHTQSLSCFCDKGRTRLTRTIQEKKIVSVH